LSLMPSGVPSMSQSWMAEAGMFWIGLAVGLSVGAVAVVVAVYNAVPHYPW
jgi:hypothetical protein